MEIENFLTVNVTENGTQKLSDGSSVKTGHVWIQDQFGNTILDTDAVSVWPLSDEHRRMIEASPAMLEVLRSISLVDGLAEAIGPKRWNDLAKVLAKADVATIHEESQ